MTVQIKKRYFILYIVYYAKVWTYLYSIESIDLEHSRGEAISSLRSSQQCRFTARETKINSMAFFKESYRGNLDLVRSRSRIFSCIP